MTDEEQKAKDIADANAKAALEKTEPAASEKTPEVEAQHAKVDAELAARNEGNREGHAKNIEKIEAQSYEAQMRTEHASDHRANHVPTGKENNRNTPRVLKDGTKVWDQ